MHKEHAKPYFKTRDLSFLGLCNYLSTYVSGLSDILHHYDNSQRKMQFFLGKLPMTFCINSQKIHFTECQYLCYYDADLPVSLETDASQSGLGVLLLQNGSPISFMSKAPTETQLNTVT